MRNGPVTQISMGSGDLIFNLSENFYSLSFFFILR